MKYTTGLAVIAALFSTSEAKFHGVAWGELESLWGGYSVSGSSSGDSTTKSDSSDSGSGSSSGDSG